MKEVGGYGDTLEWSADGEHVHYETELGRKELFYPFFPMAHCASFHRKMCVKEVLTKSHNNSKAKSDTL